MTGRWGGRSDDAGHWRIRSQRRCWADEDRDGRPYARWFFELDTPSTQGGGSDLYVDNVSVTEMQPPCPMDLDGDGDVDEADFGLFLSCASGSGVPDTGCSCVRRLISTAMATWIWTILAGFSVATRDRESR